MAADLVGLPVEVAPLLLGSELETTIDQATVRVRITEVEAYHGAGTGDRPDPGSHARMGRTARNRVMWGPPGRLYLYLSHGIHTCVNLVCGPEGVAGAVLLRAAAVVAGADTAAKRRFGDAGDPRLPARGPGNLGRSLGLDLSRHNGWDVLGTPREGLDTVRLLLPEAPLPCLIGPRVGVAGTAGTTAFPWRFWLPEDPSVSAFRWGRGAREAQP